MTTSTRWLASLLIPAFLAASPSFASGTDDLVLLARSSGKVLIADFGLGMCKQCKAQSQVLDKVKADYKGKVLVRMVHVNREHDLTARYQVEMIPLLVFFDRSGTVHFRRTGVMSYEDIASQLARMGVTP